MKRFILILSMCAMPLGFASVTPLEGLVGSYPVLQLNENHSATGMLEIVVNPDVVGLRLSGIKMATNSVPSKEVLTSAGMTQVSQDGLTITQKAQVGENQVIVEYQDFGSFMVVQYTECGGSVCAGDKVTVGKEASFGAKIKSGEFFSGKSGSYNVELVGGSKPKEFSKEVTVIPEFEEGRSLLLTPYCDKEETFCDPGYLIFAHYSTVVYLRKVSSEHSIYDIFVTEDAGEGAVMPGYYRWEEKVENGTTRIKVKNLQYRLPNGENVCLEHQLTRPNEDG